MPISELIVRAGLYTSPDFPCPYCGKPVYISRTGGGKGSAAARSIHVFHSETNSSHCDVNVQPPNAPQPADLKGAAERLRGASGDIDDYRSEIETVLRALESGMQRADEHKLAAEILRCEKYSEKYPITKIPGWHVLVELAQAELSRRAVPPVTQWYGPGPGGIPRHCVKPMSDGTRSLMSELEREAISAPDAPKEKKE